jgi:hypothetical protein
MNTAVRRVARPAFQQVQKRSMGGGHGPPPTYTGLEAKIRHYLPNNSHMALGYIAGYFGLYLFVKMLPKGAAAPAPAASAPTTDGNMPSVDSAEFGEWVGQEGNLEKLIASA